MRIIVDCDTKQRGRQIVALLQEYADEYGIYAHTSVDKYNGDTRVDVTKASRIVEEISGTAASYLLEAATSRGVSVERLIKEMAGKE